METNKRKREGRTINEKYTIIPIICKYITTFHNVHEDEIELALFTNNLIQML
jgi:hypothetical protein